MEAARWKKLHSWIWSGGKLEGGRNLHGRGRALLLGLNTKDDEARERSRERVS